MMIIAADGGHRLMTVYGEGMQHKRHITIKRVKLWY